VPDVSGGVLPAGVTASGASLDPSSSAVAGGQPARLSLGERDYSSAGSTAGTVAVSAATAQGAQASGRDAAGVRADDLSPACVRAAGEWV
jgi:hypothetical protein